MFPSLFLSHGSPTLTLMDVPARKFLSGLGQILGRPQAILIASAHWETTRPVLNAPVVNETIHDFYGFPKQLYELTYPAPGAADLVRQAQELLSLAGFANSVDRGRGLDHGAWVPLMLMYPEADIPVAQISIQTARGARYHVDLGRALAPLREKNIMVIGSGSFTHDLSRISGRDLTRASRLSEASEAASDVEQFATWFNMALIERRFEDLLDYRRQAPFAEKNHPTEEHILPIFLALGAGGQGARVECLHESTTFNVLKMNAYQFS